MSEVIRIGLGVAVFAPLASALVLGTTLLLAGRRPSERFISGLAGLGLGASLLANLAVIAVSSGQLGHPWRGEVGYGSWLKVGSYEVPAVLFVDVRAEVFGLLAAALTAMLATFSRTYMHREPGFARFYALLALFGTGIQLVAWAGSLDVLFAGWELVGVSSALFIAFFHERPEPVRSGLRAFATYRLCDAGFLLGIVATHELIGSTRLADLGRAAALTPQQASLIAGLFLLSAAGKSAQLPFSGWLPRAMEGPTPTSALFYGGMSIHAGLFLVLRIWPVLDLAPQMKALGVGIGVLTAIYASAVARTHTDAKGALAHATLAQVGLILAEICLGLITVAMAHLTCHALLRVWQYLRAPNMIHDAHRIGHAHPEKFFFGLWPALERKVFGGALHRFRLDEWIDAAAAPVLGLARVLNAADRGWSRLFSVGRGRANP